MKLIARARATIGAADFIEVYCLSALEECERRDVKGLYQRARAGEIKDFTGISAPYEAPENPDVTLNTNELSVEQCVECVIQRLVLRGVMPGGHLNVNPSQSPGSDQ